MFDRQTFHAALAAAALLAAGSGCAKHQASAPQAPYVETTVASLGAIAPSVTLSGIVAPYENVAVQSTLTEPADAVYVQEGDVVRAGDVLARLDTADLQAQLQADLATANSNRANTTHAVYQGSLAIAQAQDQLRQAQATLLNDQTNLNRDRSLLTQGYISQQAVDQQQAIVRSDQAAVASAQSSVNANGALGGSGLQESSVAQSQAQVDVALAQAQQIRVSISKATIVSPIDGVVVNRNLNPGEYPGNRQIFTLQQVDPIYAVLHASSEEIAGVDAGAAAQVTVDRVGRTLRYEGRVAGVLNEINPGSTDFQVKVKLNNPQQMLRPGMAVSAKVALPPLRGLRVPETAFTDDNHDQVMTVGPDSTIAIAKVVEVGNDGVTSIVTGLSPGQRVVTDGQTSVGSGERVSYR